MPDVTAAIASAVDAPRWSLHLCGRARVVTPAGACVGLERRDAAMLALLAIEGPAARSRVTALLWPDEPPQDVQGRLRQRIYALKRKLGVEAISGSSTLVLCPALAWPGFDGEPLDAALLGEDDYAELPEFADWLSAARQRLQGLRRECLAGEASALERQGRLAEAIACAERLLALEPLQEHAHRRLMRLHYLRGDRASALLAFDRCERALKDDVGATPSGETLELLAQIERSQALAAPAPRRVVPVSVLRPPRLVGRDAEWSALQAAWERGDAVVIVGEAGMGKTRLVGDLLRACAPAPGQALQASARPGDDRVPYALLCRLLRHVLATRAQALPDGIQAELARLLPELAPSGPTGAHDGGAEARFVGALETTWRDAVVAGLEAVVLDDLHFADTASLEMAQHLAGVPGVRWVTAFRAAEIGPAAQGLVATLTTRLGAAPLVLQPLTRAQVAELLDSLGLVGVGTLDADDATDFAGVLHHRTGGNPLFLLETIKAWCLQREPAHQRATDAGLLARLAPSASALRLIERRIGLLSRDAVRLARCAAVAGQDFSVTLAAQVLDVHPLDLTDAWAELESAQILRDGAFAHDLIFEAARESVPQPIARALHRRIAELMARQGGVAPARLAEHWLGAGEELRAAPHLAEAGRQALRALRLREGIAYLDQAQEIHGRAGDADAQCALIDELISPAMMASAFDNVQRLVEQAAHSATSDRQRAMTLRSLASLLEQRCEYQRATGTCRQALAAALAAGDRACELGARALLAQLLCEQCQAADAEEMLRPIESWVNGHGCAKQQIVHADAMAKVLQDRGCLAQALEQWQRAIDIARTNGASHVLPHLLMARATALIFTGRVQDGRDAIVEGRQLLQDIPEDAMVLRSFTIRLQVIDRMLGHYASSLTLGERVLSDPGAGPAEWEEARLPLAFAYCDLGQPIRARRLLAQAQAPAGSYMALFWKEVGAQVPQPGARLEEACRQALDAAAEAASHWAGRTLLTAWRIQARHGQDELAVAAARLGVEFTSTSGMHGQQLVFQALLAQRLARLGDTAQAVWLARDSWRLMADHCPGLVYRGVVWRALIEVLEPRDTALTREIAHHAADWIFRTAADHVPPAYRESFLHGNPFNAFLLAKVREPSR
ncbi:AAA family ATPase [Ideonella sp.]|uniref:ATP-binding protein n=1 Tax=Ideonella sp. TaxID=1929293 RepID=UPI0035B28CA4